MNPIEIIFYSTPLAIAALGEIIGQKSGVLNIGLEGMILVGAFGGMIGTTASGSPWVGLIVGIVFAILLGLLQSFFVLKLAIDQVLVGTAINLFALGVTSTFFRKQFGNSGALTSLPNFPDFYGLDLIMVLSFLLIPSSWWLLNKTKWGLFVRSCGEYPDAANAAGYSVIKLRFQASIIGAICAGISGAYLCINVAGSFTESMSAGRGMMAIAIVTFGRWHSGYVWLVALMIGFCEALQFKLQALSINVPAELALALPYVAALLVLTFVGKGGRTPQALAIPYNKN